MIINPQADRSKAAHEQKVGQSGEHLTAGVVDQDGTGLTVRGAKMLATSAIMANEVFVTCIQPLAPGDAVQSRTEGQVFIDGEFGIDRRMLG